MHEYFPAAMMDMFDLLLLEDDKEVKKRRTEVLVLGSAEDLVVSVGEHDDGANAEDEHGKAEETCSEEARMNKKKEKTKKKEKKKKKKEKKKKEKKKEKNKKDKVKKKKKNNTQITHSRMPRLMTDAEALEEDLADSEDFLKQFESPLMPLTDGGNAAHFIRQSQMVLEEARGSNDGVFLDLCCGKGGVGKRVEAVHGHRSISVDWAKSGPGIIKCDLTDPAIRIYIKKEIIEESLSLTKGFKVAGMLHVPCDTFTSARHGKPGGSTPVPLRDYGAHVWGLPGLTPKDQAKLEQGNKIARALLKIRDDLKNAGAPAALENGDQSMLFKVPQMGAEDARMLKVCYCMMGKPFRKRTRLLIWNARSPIVLEEEARRCARKYLCNSTGGVCRRTGKPHLLLRGWARGKALTSLGEKYPKKFVNIIARILCSPAGQAG